MNFQILNLHLEFQNFPLEKRPGNVGFLDRKVEAKIRRLEPENERL